MIKPPSFLLGLPNELHAIIFENKSLSDSDLASLRATCHHIKAFATKALGTRRFISLDVAYSKQGLRQFASLTASEVGPFIRCVHFIADAGLTKKQGVGRSSISDYSGLREISISHLEGHVDSLEEVFRGATHLETLRIRCEHGSIDWFSTRAEGVDHTTFTPMEQALEQTTSDRLTEIDLEGTVISADVLLHLLTRHRQTISVLSLRHCILVEGRWLKILIWIQLNLTALQVLHLSRLHLAVKRRTQRCTRPDFCTTASEQVTHRVIPSDRYPEGRLEGNENIRNILSSKLAANHSDYEGEAMRARELMAAQEKKRKARDGRFISSRILRSRRALAYSE